MPDARDMTGAGRTPRGRSQCGIGRAEGSRCRVVGVSPVVPQTVDCLGLNGEDPPRPGDAFEVVVAAVDQCLGRADDEIADCAC
jgi:hypothetical protein